MSLTRRGLLSLLASAAAAAAVDPDRLLWHPAGRKLISIPKPALSLAKPYVGWVTFSDGPKLPIKSFTFGNDKVLRVSLCPKPPSFTLSAWLES